MNTSLNTSLNTSINTNNNIQLHPPQSLLPPPSSSSPSPLPSPLPSPQTCFFCLEPLNSNIVFNNSDLFICNCKLKIHSHCLEQWLQTNSECPICRTDSNDIYIDIPSSASDSTSDSTSDSASDSTSTNNINNIIAEYNNQQQQQHQHQREIILRPNSESLYDLLCTIDCFCVLLLLICLIYLINAGYFNKNNL